MELPNYNQKILLLKCTNHFRKKLVENIVSALCFQRAIPKSRRQRTRFFPLTMKVVSSQLQVLDCDTSLLHAQPSLGTSMAPTGHGAHKGLVNMALIQALIQHSTDPSWHPAACRAGQSGPLSLT
jgi:hypothetical protein